MANLSPGVERPAERAVAAARDRAQDEAARVLDAAFTVLLRAGRSGFKVENVLREGGISTRAFYRYFPQRSDLIRAMLERAVAEQAEILRAKTERADDPRAQVNAWIDGALDIVHGKDFEQQNSLFGSEWRELVGEYPDEYLRSLAALAAPLAEVLEAGQAVGAFHPDVRPKRDAMATLHLVFGIGATLSMQGRERACSREEAAAAARPYVLRALFRA
jgi:AcrR family transcriptional regulator